MSQSLESRALGVLNRTTSYQVRKYSFATTPGNLASNTKVDWTHLHAEDVYVVLDRVYSAHHGCPLLCLKVIQKTQDLEIIRVGELAVTVQNMIRTAQAQGRSLLQKELPLYAIATVPRLGLKYRLPSGQERRVEVAFVQPSDCQAVISQIQDLGVPVGSKPPQPASNPIRPASRRGLVGDSIDRSSSVLSLASMAPPARASFPGNGYANLQPNAHSSPHNASNYDQRPVWSEQGIPGLANMSEAGIYQTRIDHSALAVGGSSFSDSRSMPLVSSPLRPASTTSTFLDMQTSSSPTLGPSDSASVTHRSRASPLLPPSMGQQQHQTPSLPGSSRDPTRWRDTAPTQSERPRRPVSAMDLPPLPKPTPVNTLTNSSTTSRVTSSPRNQSAQDIQRSDSSIYRTKITSPQGIRRLAPPTPSFDLITAQANAVTTPRHALSGTERGIPRTSGAGDRSQIMTPAPREPLATRSPNEAHRTASVANANHEVIDKHGGFLTRPDQRPTTADTETLASYASQSTAERQRALDDFFCQNLESEDFMTLCKDVDACWRRIGLGL